MKHNSLAFSIISRIVLYFTLLLALITVCFYVFAIQSIERYTRANTQLMGEKLVNDIEQVMRPFETIPVNLSWMMEANAIPKDSLFSFLESLIRNNKSLLGSAIAFEPYLYRSDMRYFSPYACRIGDSVTSFQLGSSGYNYHIMDWYQIPAMIREPYWSEPYYDVGAGNALITTYSVPFYLNINGKRTFAGIITADVSLDWLSKTVNSVRVFNSGYAFLVSRSGRFITSPKRFANRIMNETIFTLAKESNTPELRTLGRNMIKGKKGNTSLSYDGSGKQWVYFLQLPSTKWSLGIILPYREMFTDPLKMNYIVLLITIVGMVLLVIIMVNIVQSKTRPLSLFAESALAIAKGDFQTDLPAIKTNDEMKELYNSFVYMQQELSEYITNLETTTSAKEKIESELRIAREIQLGLIPHQFPPFPDLPEIDIFASLVSAKEVGGDLYDFFLLDEKLLCFAVGDVSGKGVPSSLFMAMAQTLLRSNANKDRCTADTMATINRTLSINNDSNMFVTFFLGILDLVSGQLRYCNAGHNPPVLIEQGNKASFLPLTTAIPLGLFETTTFKEDTLTIVNGDQLFLYTDGVTEAENAQHEFYSDHRLLDTLCTNAQATPRELIAAINDDIAAHVDGYSQSDDLTMLSIKYHGRSK